jgi:hypothetical protein
MGGISPVCTARSLPCQGKILLKKAHPSRALGRLARYLVADSLPLQRHVGVKILNLAALVEPLEYTIKNVTVKEKMLKSHRAVSNTLFDRACGPDIQ